MMASEISNLRSVPALLDGVWRVFSDLRTTLVLVMLTAVALLLRTFVPGFADGTGGPFLRLLLSLLAFSLALRLAVHAAQAIDFRKGRPTTVPAIAPMELEMAGPVEPARRRVEDAMREAYDVTLATAEGSGVYGARRRGGVVGPLLAAGGPLVLLLGLLVNAVAGWSKPEIIVTQSGSAATDALRLALTQLSESSIVTVERRGAQSVELRVAPNMPAAAGSLWLLGQELGPTLEASAKDAAGRPLALLALESGTDPQPALSLAFPPTQTEQAFSAPEQGVVFRIVSYTSLPERGIPGPVFLVEAYRDGETAAALSELVEDEATLALDGVSYNLRRGRYVKLLAANLPGWPLVALGGLLTAAGLLIALLWGPQEAWAALQAKGRDVTVALRTSGGLRPGKDAEILAEALSSGSD